MSDKPILCLTHPRACSTAFERIFMTRKDLTCMHEPLGDAFYYGPERLGDRYQDDEAARKATGFAESSYATVFEAIEREKSSNKRVFIKDMAYYICPPRGLSSQVAPSLLSDQTKAGKATAVNTGTGPSSEAQKDPFPYGTYSEPGNPSVVPRELLKQFHFTFLIRDPHYSIPSYYRCTVPPLNTVTGWFNFDALEAGYDELHRMFDYILASKFIVSPSSATSEHQQRSAGTVNGSGDTNPANDLPKICIIDAEDLLSDPAATIKAYCQSVGLTYSPDMLHWSNEESNGRAHEAFAKWPGWHEDALNSAELHPRPRRAAKTKEQFDQEWTEKYGEQGARTIRKCVDDNIEDFRYLKQFALEIASDS